MRLEDLKGIDLMAFSKICRVHKLEEQEGVSALAGLVYGDNMLPSRSISDMSEEELNEMDFILTTVGAANVVMELLKEAKLI